MASFNCCLWALLVLIAFSNLRPYNAEEAAEEEDQCYDRSCYPATGNLVIGRKYRLFATSTCGLAKKDRYCIVSHLEDKTKCFYCDSRQPWMPNREPNRFSHRIENVVTENYNDRTKNWWQSENGVQNVSIRLDLEAEFHFTHLIMTFRSFRPAAMIIERSSDFGKTWSVYRYFAYDCATTFPDIPEGPPKKHNDVICTRKYSDVAPSTGGEIVYKVISPHIPTENPYADEIANLLKVTNIRINFTKLHTLGDDLLDYRPEIDEKYYYALYELVVRGSCSCYGHAQRCIPIEGDGVGYSGMQQDMVHGRCECTHNTKGLNCEQCQDFFNDLPWRPAIGEESNECRRCECNGHASRCHFDQAVYNASGFVSGGVCDDCAHNTQGKNCEQCKPYFYRDPLRQLYDPYVCRPCECDNRGSLNDGICEGEEDPARKLVAGKCYCKSNVDGNNCDRCKNGFWDLRADDPDGCKKCSCNLLGTWNNEGCNKNDGTCLCKRLVTGENCDQCLPEHYGLSEDPEGCKPCDCFPGGSLDNQCDILTGTCKCRPHFSGRRCDTTDSSYYCPNIDHLTYEAEKSEIHNADIETREGALETRTWTGEGFVRVKEGSNISFIVDNIPKSGLYNLVIRYELDGSESWENININIVRPGDPAPDGPCGNIQPADDFLIARFHAGFKYTEVNNPICFDKGVRYEIRVSMGQKRFNGQDYSATALIDSLVVAMPTDSLDIFQGPDGQRRKQEYDAYQCRHSALHLLPYDRLSPQCQQLICAVAGTIFGEGYECECDPTGSKSGICSPRGGQCECKPNVVDRKCDKCAVGTYGFGPNGCSPCDCDSVGSLSNNCNKQSGQCECRDRGITGRQCNECQPGFWSFPDCHTCQCNGHASICDQKTGACIDCRNLTDGNFCDRCKPGYYGDPRLGVNRPCKPCPCPGGPGSGKQHADTCYIQPSYDFQSNDIICNCKAGYTGERCDQCSINYWGNPQDIGGSCEPCECNGNIDRGVEGSCDAKTGECLKCLYNTEGARCENCVDGYFGDAQIRNCQRCVCNHLGTDESQGSCNKVSGQCPCFPNVMGMRCDECAPLHFNLSSGAGCASCACDPSGVITDAEGNPRLECNHIDGQCHCKDGRGGRTCSECQDLYWGDPVNGECKRCECDQYGAATAQCHRDNGTCICRPGSGGPLCNQCARGYTGNWPQCQACGECFDNWDRILQSLKGKLDDLIRRANSIEDKGISSQFDNEFEEMEGVLDDVRSQLDAVNITNADIDSLKKAMESLNNEVAKARELIEEKSQRSTGLGLAVDAAAESVKTLNETAQQLTKLAEELNENATEIRRSDVQGAYEIIKGAVETSSQAERTITEEVNKLSKAEDERIKTVELLKEHEKDFDAQYVENSDALQKISGMLSLIDKELPALNKDVCGAESAPCDALCGGPGSRCSHCGGNSCGTGSITKAQQALDFAKEADNKIEAKQKEAEELLKPEVAHKTVLAAAEKANRTRNEIQQELQNIEEFLNAQHTQPKEIYELADQVIKITIPYEEKEIKELAEKIRQKVAETKDTDRILAETSGNKTMANELQRSAEDASKRAFEIRNVTLAIREAIKKTEEAQNSAQTKLDETQQRIANARTSLVNSDDQIVQLEDRAKNATELVQRLQNVTDNLKAEYIKITSSSKAAGNSATSASDIATELEERQKELDTKYNTVKTQVEERENGNDDRKDRAQKLRKQTTKLLTKIKQHNDEIESLEKSADTLEIELADYQSKLDALSDEIDMISKKLTQRADYHATCDA
uniref:Laminin subunit beta-1 n=1 Tax=Panagrolaimus sp. PS1159 TaxID=55785 RepID=A0AC35F6W6_9BILA